MAPSKLAITAKVLPVTDVSIETNINKTDIAKQAVAIMFLLC